MSRGGVRQGAGRKSTWASGCNREDTIPIRVPKYIKDKIWDYAHKLDSGEDLECVVNSLRQENEQLKAQLTKQRSQSSKETSQKDLIDLRDQALKLLKVGTQSKTYKLAKDAFDYFIKYLNV